MLSNVFSVTLFRSSKYVREDFFVEHDVPTNAKATKAADKIDLIFIYMLMSLCGQQTD